MRQLLATEILFDSSSPNRASFIEVHLGSIAAFQTINGFGQIFAKTFVFDIIKRV